MKIRSWRPGRTSRSSRSGRSRPKPVPIDELGVGEVGFLIANIKNVADAQIGDTVTETARPTPAPFPGFTEMKPMVFAGLYPVDGHQYPELRDALEKLRLNDAAFVLRARDVGGARASASAAASSACCTWRSCRSGSSASSTSTWSRPRRACSTA